MKKSHKLILSVGCTWEYRYKVSVKSYLNGINVFASLPDLRINFTNSMQIRRIAISGKTGCPNDRLQKRIQPCEE
jgi:hypothetical protein